MRGALFTRWCSYDETPHLCRIDSMDADGTLESEAGSAKIMCALLGFSMTLRVRTLQDGAETWRSHIVHGKLDCELVPVASQTIPMVANYISQKLCLPEGCQDMVRELFPATAVLACTDMHRSYLPAERVDAISWRSASKAAAADGGVPSSDAADTHATASFRCSMHRARTFEKSFVALDVEAESFLMNFTLSLSHNDVLRSLREQVQAWAVDPSVLAWRRGLGNAASLAELREWRQHMEAILFSEPPSQGKERRRMFWQRVHTGDPRKRGIIEHICPGPSCCKTRADLEAKVLGPYGVRALLRPAPGTWPRKSCSGQSEVACHVLQCQLTGGMISAHLPLVAKMAAARALKASERVRALDHDDAGREDVVSERARALWAETQAEQERSGCVGAAAFCASPGAVPRLICLWLLSWTGIVS